MKIKIDKYHIVTVDGKTYLYEDSNLIRGIDTMKEYISAYTPDNMYIKGNCVVRILNRSLFYNNFDTMTYDYYNLKDW